MCPYVAFFGTIVASVVILRQADYKKQWPKWYWYPWFACCGLFSAAISAGVLT